MTRTLGDLTKELKEKIVSPAKAESEQILREAREEAKRIVTEAERDASRIREAARKEAETVLKQMEIDMNTAARNFVLLVQEQLEKAIVQPTVEAELKPLLDDPKFLEKIIEELVGGFLRLHGEESKLEILLPEKTKDELGRWFVEKFRQKMTRPLVVHFTERVSFGFKIGLEGTGSHFNFGEGLVEAFTEFCSPRFRRHFLAEKES
jgi:V/A-type H+/Na+-transporting ATPase subunit E